MIMIYAYIQSYAFSKHDWTLEANGKKNLTNKQNELDTTDKQNELRT